jgi:hypothetical protein
MGHTAPAHVRQAWVARYNNGILNDTNQATAPIRRSKWRWILPGTSTSAVSPKTPTPALFSWQIATYSLVLLVTLTAPIRFIEIVLAFLEQAPYNTEV